MRSSVPVLLVDDVNATAEWYASHLGFETAGIFPPDPPAGWASLQRGGAEIMLQALKDHRKAGDYDRRDGGVWDVYVRMNGVRRFYESIENQPFIKRALRKQPYGDWEFEVEDLNGYVLVFGGDETVA
jgi:catechol 2,3-dioxygenase-like lactoylglutathione lyase family enzyme